MVIEGAGGVPEAISLEDEYMKEVSRILDLK